MTSKTDFRPSPIAGHWYSGNSRQLSASVDGYIQAATLPETEGEIIAIIAPHAGYIYSGPVAGYAYAAIQMMTPDLVAVISPMHHHYFEPLLTSGHEAYETPLGAIPIDRKSVKEVNDRLESEGHIGITAIRKDQEHALEIQLPFLQRSLKNAFSLLPIMVRDQGVKVTRALGLALATVLKNKKSLLVASTDLSHFYSQETANKLDKEMLRRFESFDPEAILKAESEGAGFACGRGAVAAVLWAAKEMGANQVEILKYATSGDVSGDYHQVVGYGAAVIAR